ncbi:MAG: gliding motility-associated peptidyl-prolyl isomerase GldI [Flavobacteriaceae bacterium]
MRNIPYIILGLLFAYCGGPEARKPVEVKTGSFIKQSVERNRELLASEEKLINSLITADSTREFISTDFGAWYSYQLQVPTRGYLPVENDLVTMTYDILSLQNDTLYSQDEIGSIEYLVDREELFPGLRMGVKLLQKGETATFLLPSHLGFGYHGDDKRIGPNIPLKSTVTIIDIEQSKDSIPN